MGRGGMGRRAAGPPVESERISVDDVAAWLAGRLPDDWFEAPPAVTVDRDEILVVGRLRSPELPKDADEPTHAAAEVGRISRFREDTRDQRMAVAHEAEHRFARTISWGAESGSTTAVFTNLSVPVMTRLRQPERRVLDTLVDSGVARSRSDASGLVREAGVGQHRRVAREPALGHVGRRVGARPGAHRRLTNFGALDRTVSGCRFPSITSREGGSQRRTPGSQFFEMGLRSPAQAHGHEVDRRADVDELPIVPGRPEPAGPVGSRPPVASMEVLAVGVGQTGPSARGRTHPSGRRRVPSQTPSRR